MYSRRAEAAACKTVALVNLCTRSLFRDVPLQQYFCEPNKQHRVSAQLRASLEALHRYNNTNFSPYANIKRCRNGSLQLV